MRTHDEYRLLLRLWEDGQNKKNIALYTGIECIQKFDNGLHHTSR